jgi:hypothetical protein
MVRVLAHGRVLFDATKQRHRTVPPASAGGELMRNNLAQLCATVRDPAARKRGMFALWDECAETGTAEIIKAGSAARAKVLGFIRARLPAGSPDAFTRAELATLNQQKQSRAVFAPYD